MSYTNNQGHIQATGNKPKALSLFTGAGGLDIGFHRLGFDIIACVEVEPIFCKTLESNRRRYFSDTCQIICADIRQLEPAALNIEAVDIIVGGPPCQSFSAAGRRAGGVTGISDMRGSLFEHYCRFVSHFQPQAFIFENVRGILQGNKGRDWQEILSQFVSLGYSLFYKVLDAADYGVPQHRERLILVGVNKGSFLFPRPIHGPDSLTRTPYVTAYEAIADLQPENEPTHDYGGKYGRLLQEVPPGMNYHYFTKELGYPRPIFAWRSRFSDFLYKADPDKPTKTIVARLGKYSGPFHWKSRKFTLDEFKRLQSFPDDYEFAGSLQEQLQQIGNSVAPKFADALASALKKQLFEPDYPVELLPEHYHLSFDTRKSTKAKSTRRKRLSLEDEMLPSLFAPESSTTGQEEHIEFDESTQTPDMSVSYYLYLSAKKRVLVDEHMPPEGSFRFEMRRYNEDLYIDISKRTQHSFLLAPTLEYTLNFTNPIGDGLKRIVCMLQTNSGLDIPVAWDAIELGLQAYSNYHSLMDIYGHFTEPHPIFSLNCSVKNCQDDPIIRGLFLTV